MKKVILLLGALLAVSATTMAEESGFTRTAVETGTIYYEDGKTKQFTDFILTDGFFKGETWGDFGLGFVAKRGHNEDNDHDGYAYVELRPEYVKGFSWGNVGGKLIVAQEKIGNSANGADMLKPEIFGTYNINPKSRVFARALYSNREVTGVEKVDKWLEVEGQYLYDIGGGTAGAGVFVAPGMDKKTDGYATDDIDEARAVGFYRKWWPQIALYTDFHGDVRAFEDPNNDNSWNSTRVGVYTSKPVFKGFVVEAEYNRYQHFNESWKPKESFSEDRFMLGLRYAY